MGPPDKGCEFQKQNEVDAEVKNLSASTSPSLGVRRRKRRPPATLNLDKYFPVPVRARR